MRLFVTVLMCAMATLVAQAQYTVNATQGFGPFPQGQTVSNVFTFGGVPSGTTIDSVKFAITSGSGTTLRVVAQRGWGPNTWTVNMGTLPWMPAPSIQATAFLRTPYTRYTATTRPQTIEIVKPAIAFTSTNNFGPVIVGRPHSATFRASNLPSGTTRVVIALTDTTGSVVATKDTSGTGLTAAQLTYTTPRYPGRLTANLTVRYATEPPNGYADVRLIRDSLVPATVTATQGFGPFVPATHLMNTFTVAGLGPSCTTIQWILEYPTVFGGVRTPVNVTVPYDSVLDRVTFTYDMRNISPGTTLRVLAKYGSGSLSAETRIPLIMPTRADAPVIRITDSLPLIYGSSRVDTAIIDSLPARIVWARLTLSDVHGTVIRQAVQTASNPQFLESVRLAFPVNALPASTATLQVELMNDAWDEAQVYAYDIEVRDTTAVFLFADTWGPFVVGDSASISPGATFFPPISGASPSSVFGRFVIVDSSNTAKVFAVSPNIDLNGLRSADTLIYWPDTSYRFGNAIVDRAHLRTDSLPLSAIVRFDRFVVRGTDTTLERSSTHPINMLPSPGVLACDQGFGPHPVATVRPLRFTMSNLSPGTTKVRFRVSGFMDVTPVDEGEIIVQPGQTSVEWTTDAGKLPVNAQVWATVFGSQTSAFGTTVRRTLFTTLDTLSMTSTVRIDTVTLRWATQPGTSWITGSTSQPIALTIGKIPAQTREIQVISYDDSDAVLGDSAVRQARVIDSVSVPVPYFVRYQDTLRATIPFAIRQFNTRSIQIRFVSDGGPDGGVRFTRPVTVQPPSFSFEALAFDTVGGARILETAIRQGSTDYLQMTASWSIGSSILSNAGLAAGVAIDSVIFRARDCAGNIVATESVTPTPALVGGGVAASLNYIGTELPFATDRVEFTVFSRSLSLPSSGVTLTDTITMVPFPQFQSSFGRYFPPYRVTDTTAGTLIDTGLVITNVNGIFEIDDMRIVDRNGATVTTFGTVVPNNGRMKLSSYDMNLLPLSGSPFRLLGTLRTDACGRQVSYPYEFATFVIDTTGYPQTGAKNWVYSSLGWGPFRQGHVAVPTFTTRISPTSIFPDIASGDSISVFITMIDTADKSLSMNDGRTTTFVMPTTIPQFVTANAPIDLTPYGSDHALAVQVKRMRPSTTGGTPPDVMLYRFPLILLDLPDQPLTSNKRVFEQSVLPQNAGTTIMPDPHTFLLDVEVTTVDSIQLSYYNERSDLLFTRMIPHDADLDSAGRSKFWSTYDVAQWPWPYIARDNDEVDVRLGYIFHSKTDPRPPVTKIQRTFIEIEPRADWLNGARVSLSAPPSSTTIPLNVTIPFPRSWFGVVLPMLNQMIFGVGFNESNEPLFVPVMATYDVSSKGFKFDPMQGSDEYHFNPTIINSLGYDYQYNIWSDSGSTVGSFTALRSFDTTDGIPHRDLRVRSLYQSSATVNYSRLERFIQSIGRIIATLSGAGSATPWFDVKLLFTIGGGTEQISVVNLATEASGSLQHIGSAPVPPVPSAANLVPSSEAIGVNLFGGGAIEVLLLKGFLGFTASITADFLVATGEVYSGSINAVHRKFYPPTVNPSVWFDLDMKVAWGLYKKNLWHAKLYSWRSPNIMPSFTIFGDAWNPIYKPLMQKDEDRTQGVERLSRLPDETPYYHASPAISASDSAMVAVWVEHSELDGSGTLVLGSLDRTAHQFSRTATITKNRNGMHDPSVAVMGGSGDAVIAWAQNSLRAGQVSAEASPADLLLSEDVHVAIYDSATRTIVGPFRVNDGSSNRIDGAPQVAVADDGSHALLVWQATNSLSSASDIHAVRLSKVGTAWELGDVQRVTSTTGEDRDISIESRPNGTYVVAWLHDNIETGQRDAMFAINDANTWSTPEIVASSDVASSIVDVDMAADGDHLAVTVIRHTQRDTAEARRSVVLYTSTNDAWSAPETVDIGDTTGVVRHVDLDVDRDGTFFLALDLYDVTGPGKGERSLITVHGADVRSSATWKVERNNPDLFDAGFTAWHSRSVVGPDRTMYLLNQELDTIPGNRQLYRNGLPIGANRCNLVLRAVQPNDRGELVARRFGGQPVSVDDDATERFEQDLRYRPYLMDPVPNPTNDASLITVGITIPSTITVELVDAVGRRVALLFHGQLDRGIHGIPAEMGGLAPGMYHVVMTDVVGTRTSVPLAVVR